MLCRNCGLSSTVDFGATVTSVWNRRSVDIAGASVGNVPQTQKSLVESGESKYSMMDEMA